MKAPWLLAAVLVFVPAALSAQTMSAGIVAGGMESLEDGLDFNLGDSMAELFVGIDLDDLTTFKIIAGRVQPDEDPAGNAVDNGEVEYIHAAIEYRFSEVYGSTGVFLGPGLYRGELGSVNQTELGVSGGVNGYFPVTRRFALMAQVAYHWVNFDEKYRFLTAGGGVRFAF